jgi:hypothetical protein
MMIVVRLLMRSLHRHLHRRVDGILQRGLVPGRGRLRLLAQICVLEAERLAVVGAASATLRRVCDKPGA